MDLSKSEKNKKYIIKNIGGDSDYLSKFAKLGFHPGQEVTLRRKAPLFGSPMLFQIEFGQYALTKKEAAMVEVVLAEEIRE